MINNNNKLINNNNQINKTKNYPFNNCKNFNKILKMLIKIKI